VGPVCGRLDQGRIHFQHGPIDLVIFALGESAVIEEAHAKAWARFGQILPELVAELPDLRQAIDPRVQCGMVGPVARRMWSACRPFARDFITPMAAVAGSVSDEIVDFYRTAGVRRAAINNGGDIALHLEAGERMRIAVVPDISDPHAAHDPGKRLHLNIDAANPVRSVATSGWPGRSFSLGIADSVTILALTAAQADAAATAVANAVNVDHPLVVRRPARELQPDSDLGDRLVTVAVPALPETVVHDALDAGEAKARELLDANLIAAAVLVCQGRVRMVGRSAFILQPP